MNTSVEYISVINTNAEYIFESDLTVFLKIHNCWIEKVSMITWMLNTTFEKYLNLEYLSIQH